MSKKKLDVVIIKKCSHCKLKETGECEGQYAVKNAILVTCPAFVDARSNKITKGNKNIPFPPIKKSKTGVAK